MKLPDVIDVIGPDADPTPPEPPAERRSWASLIVVSTIVVLAAVVALAAALASSRSDGGSASTPAASSEPRTIRYLAPLGTGDRIDAGEEVEIIPAELTLHVGDELILLNEDDREHSIAGYQVRPGDTVTISYPRPGLYMNSCSVNTDELVYIYVVP